MIYIAYSPIIAYNPYFHKSYKSPPYFHLIHVFCWIYFFAFPLFDHDAFMHHPLHVLDASEPWDGRVNGTAAGTNEQYYRLGYRKAIHVYRMMVCWSMPNWMRLPINYAMIGITETCIRNTRCSPSVYPQLPCQRCCKHQQINTQNNNYLYIRVDDSERLADTPQHSSVYKPQYGWIIASYCTSRI